MALATSTIVALAAAAAASAASAANTRATARKQDQAAAQGIQQQAQVQQRANQRINTTLDKTASDDNSQYQQTAADQYLRAVRAKRANAGAGFGTAGVSDTYAAARDKAANDQAGYGDEFATLASHLDAPGNQRQAEGFRYGNLGIDLDIANRDSQNQAFLTQLRARGIQRNPWIDAGAAALGGYATGSGYGGTG